MDTNIVWLGFVASLLAGLGTGVGGLGVFVFRRLSDRLEDVLFSIAAWALFVIHRYLPPPCWAASG